jgi:hypothetical protein
MGAEYGLQLRVRSHFRKLGQARPMRQQSTATPTPRREKMASLDQPVGDWEVVPREGDRRVKRGIATACTGRPKMSIAQKKKVIMTEDHVDVV